MKKTFLAILVAGLLSMILCACGDTTTTDISTVERTQPGEQAQSEDSDYSNTSVAKQNNEDSAFSLEEPPVGIEFHREIIEDYIYKQTVKINDDGTIDITEYIYSTDPNDKVNSGRISSKYYLIDEEAIWDPEGNSYLVEHDHNTGFVGDPDIYKVYYNISLLSDDIILLECRSTSDDANEYYQRLNGEYHKHNNISAPTEKSTSTPLPSASEDECPIGGAHLWVGHIENGMVICSKCDEHYASSVIVKKKGSNLTSVEKAIIYWTLNSYLTALDNSGRYTYTEEEAFSLTGREFGVTKQFLKDNIWNATTWNDYAKYYTR